MEKDILYDLIEERLLDTSHLTESADDFVYEIVAQYLFHLMSIGNIPAHFLDLLEQDLREEVSEIIRKRTYGSVSLRHYRMSQLK